MPTSSFFKDTPTTEIYTLSLHDALPISQGGGPSQYTVAGCSETLTWYVPPGTPSTRAGDRKSTRLNSSHTVISYAVFCLKKKTRTSTHSLTPLNSAVVLSTTRSRNTNSA